MIAYNSNALMHVQYGAVELLSYVQIMPYNLSTTKS